MSAPLKNTRYPLEPVGVLIVVLHFVVGGVHGAAHGDLHIALEAWQSVYVLVVITVLPLVSGYLLWRRRRGGFLILLGSMSGALVFGGYYHFIAVGADNVASLGSHAWATPFQVTAVLLALMEVAGVFTGILGVRRKR